MTDAIHTSECAERMADVLRELATAAIDAALITPGGNLEYLTGYRGSITTERITCLVLAPGRPAVLLVPRLELPLVQEALAGDLEVTLVTWDDGQDSLDRLAALLPDNARRIAVDEQMWSERSSGVAERSPAATFVSASPILQRLRSSKSAAEIEALAEAGTAIDVVHRQIGDWLRAGRTEREVGRDVAAAILAAGHTTVEFVIVASGPNSASPHADLSDRVIREGEPIVVDIGGRMPSGYNSDCTRTYVVGEPSQEFQRLYSTLLQAQRLQCDQVRPGILAQELDAIGRSVIEEGGYGEYFVHRTGHGIGLETHEQPYVVAGSPVPLEVGAAFSIEPGIYLPGVGGARIEDIVVCQADGGRRLNQESRELRLL
jgi:Xaa-Pro aminopeptidase